MQNTNFRRSVIDAVFSAHTLLKLGAILLLTTGFAYINRGYLFTELYEVGDFAANSLLIQHAKDLELLVGNYSRVGFNHPGPAILYVLALGEWLFHDCLGIVKAPFAGQIIGEGAYSSFWIVMLATLLVRMYRSIAIAGVALILMLAATVFFDYNIITGLWFPHLYYFPFATFTLALMLLIGGRSDALIILAVSCGFLIHGHVSFVAICGLMLLGGLLANNRWSRRNADVPRVFAVEFAGGNRNKFLAVGFIFILFFSPLLLETLIHFPGPVAKYISFSQGGNHHSFSSALRYAANYWTPGFTPLLAAILMILLFANDQRRNDDPVMRGQRRPARYQVGVSVALLSATAALIFYAMYGIDDLQFVYIGLFYYAVPALALALIIANFLVARTRNIQIVVAVVVAAIALPYIYRQASKPVGYAPNYHDAHIAQYFDRMQTLGNGAIVLDLDNSQDWGRIWSTLLGVEVYAARHGKPQLFCINKNWHISFAIEGRCTDAQIQNNNRYIVSTSTKLAQSTGQQNVLDLDGINFYKYRAIALANNQMLNVAKNQQLYAGNILDGGWSPPEGEFVWSEGKRSKLSINVDQQPPPAHIKFDLAAFLPRDNSRQEAHVFINDIDAGKIIFDAANNRGVRTLALTPAMLTKAGSLSVQFNIANPTSPQANGNSQDFRLLGIALYGVEVGD
jgi:hypothetical protein